MRHLVYRVQPLPQSLLPLVWDFGSLKSAEESEHATSGLPRDAESQYIRQMLVKSVSSCAVVHYGLLLPIHTVWLIIMPRLFVCYLAILFEADMNILFFLVKIKSIEWC